MVRINGAFGSAASTLEAEYAVSEPTNGDSDWKAPPAERRSVETMPIVTFLKMESNWRLCGLSILYIAVTTLLSLCASPECLAQTASSSRPVAAEFFPEEGCPVKLESVKAILDLDPFDAPIASRIYITYKNVSNRPISAVKFRVRYSDDEKKDKGTFHAPDIHPLPPGQVRSQKWKRDGGLHPSIASFQIRVLQVRFSDGANWNSKRLKNVARPEDPDSDSGDMGSGGEDDSNNEGEG